MQDERYRTVFAFPRMVEDLLRGFAARQWADTLDFSTLRKMPAEYVSDERLVRRGDTVWEVGLDERRAVLVVVEFQSSEDPRMALRLLAYTALLYQELARNDAPGLDEAGRLPAVLPVVLYTGEARWTAAREVEALVQPVPAVLTAYRPAQRHFVLDARHVGVEDLPEPNLVTAVVRLEQTRTPWDLVEVARRLRRWLRRPDDDGLRRVLGSWVREVAESFVPPGEALGAELTLEEVEMTVVERAKEWSRQLIREGREQGLEQGREQGIEQGRELGREQGLEQGLEQGRKQGLAHERALLRRMAALRFGADTAERLEEVVAGIADPERLAEAGEWLVRCETGDELLARVNPARPGSGPGRH